MAGSTDARPDDARRAAIVFNPVKVDEDALRSLVRAAEEREGWAPSAWFATSKDDPGGDATRRALEAGASMVVAAGGDGTVRAVAEEVAAADAVLGLLPSGTGNLLARNLDLTTDDAEHAVAVAFGGADRAIDLADIDVRWADGSTTTHAFLVMAGAGIDARMLAATDETLKARIGWLAYGAALVTALRESNRFRMRFRADDGRTRAVHAHTVIVGNCGTLTANILLLPEAAVDDGVLDVVFLQPSGVVGWAQALWKVLWENGVLRRLGRRPRTGTSQDDALHYVRGRSIAVDLGEPQEIELDGDPIGRARRFRVRVRPGALRVRVPAE